MEMLEEIDCLVADVGIAVVEQRDDRRRGHALVPMR